MLTGMTNEDWRLVLKVFSACPLRGDKGRDDRLFLEAMHYFFTVENVAWRRLPERFGK